MFSDKISLKMFVYRYFWSLLFVFFERLKNEKRDASYLLVLMILNADCSILYGCH